LKKFCAHYGKLKWARVVIDKESGTSKGTAFAKYFTTEDAQRLIDYSRNYELFLLGKNPQFKRDPKINL
jgi:RNA recognition motif-containing protein